MRTNEEILMAISRELEMEISNREHIMKLDVQTFSLVRVEADKYNTAWERYASFSVILHHLYALRHLVKEGQLKAVENFIRLTIYQIRQTTDESVLDSEETTGDLILDGKRELYNIFWRFFSLFD